MKDVREIFWILFLSVMVPACNESGHEYKIMEQRELESGVLFDSLFQGLYFGMPHREFRDHCMEMHIQKHFREGGLKNGAWLEWAIDDLEYPAAVNFYPKFSDKLISEVQGSIYYDSEIKFTKANPFSQDKLLADVLIMFSKWYDTEFIKIKSPESSKSDLYITVNGNRRLTVYKDHNGYMVDFWFVDLTVKDGKNDR